MYSTFDREPVKKGREITGEMCSYFCMRVAAFCISWRLMSEGVVTTLCESLLFYKRKLKKCANVCGIMP